LAGFSFNILTVFRILFPLLVQTLLRYGKPFWFFELKDDVRIGPLGKLLVHFEIVMIGLEGFIHGSLEKAYIEMLD
jgi:hypothetical protein